MNDLDRPGLQHFHAVHFPGQHVPNTNVLKGQLLSENEQQKGREDNSEGDDLGYYKDGVKRTLTDEQIAMFRHSEIQRLLKKKN
jgi:hypothetical protein